MFLKDVIDKPVGFDSMIRRSSISEYASTHKMESRGGAACEANGKASDDTVLLERICAAYIKATEEEAQYSEEYGASPWWQNIQVNHLFAVRDALQARDIPKLRSMYENFFQDLSGKGLVRLPPGGTSANSQFELNDEDRCLVREDMFYRLGYWRKQTNDRFSVSVLRGPSVGNPFGVMIEGTLIPAGAEYQHACADRIVNLTSRQATVVEIGGGFGQMAYYLLEANPEIKYLDFDIPESLALAAYYLGKSAPDRAMLLYGEVGSLHDSITNYDIALMPPWEMGKLATRSVELTFASHVLSDLIPAAREKYLQEIARFTNGLLVEIGREESNEALGRFAGHYDLLFSLVDKRPSDWNVYRAPEAREWERLLRPSH